MQAFPHTAAGRAYLACLRDMTPRDQQRAIDLWREDPYVAEDALRWPPPLRVQIAARCLGGLDGAGRAADFEAWLRE